MKNPAVDPGELQTHMLGTYHSVRLGVGILGIGLVLSIWLFGPRLDDAVLRGSLSAYYYSDMRNVFVGLLVAIGALLYLYKGFSTAENLTLNLAGLLAVGVAWFPTAPEGTPRDTVAWIHAGCAIAFFVCIGYVSVFRADDTLSLIPNADVAKRYRAAYKALGIGMIASPLLALITSTVLDPGGNNRSIVFYIEAAGVVMFAAYWLVKSWEMRTGLADAAAGAALLKNAVPSEKKRSAPGNLVVAEHDTAYQEMLEATAAKGAARGAGSYPSVESRLPTKR